MEINTIDNVFVRKIKQNNKMNQKVSCTRSLFPVNLEGDMYELILGQIRLDLGLS